MITQRFLDIIAGFLAAIVEGIPDFGLNSVVGNLSIQLNNLFELMNSLGPLIPWPTIATVPVFLGIVMTAWTIALMLRFTFWVANR